MKKKPFNPYTMCWVVNEYRKDHRTGPITTIPRSRYVQKLFDDTEKWRKPSCN